MKACQALFVVSPKKEPELIRLKPLAGEETTFALLNQVHRVALREPFQYRRLCGVEQCGVIR